MLMDRDRVKVEKHTRKEQGQYLAILTKQALSIKNLLQLEGKTLFPAGHNADKIAPSCLFGQEISINRLRFILPYN